VETFTAWYYGASLGKMARMASGSANLPRRWLLPSRDSPPPLSSSVVQCQPAPAALSQTTSESIVAVALVAAALVIVALG
jgi:hypothetical protein